MKNQKLSLVAFTAMMSGYVRQAIRKARTPRKKMMRTGLQEKARRLHQIERGQLRVENGLVKKGKEGG